MGIIWLYSLGSVFIVSAVSLVGVFTLSMNQERLHKIVFFLVALAVGAILGDVFVHIIPQLFKDNTSPRASVLIFVGFLVFFVLEKFLRWHHSHGLESESSHGHESEKSHLGYMNLFSDGVHNLIDGILIGASYLVSTEIGIATTVAVILHEIPQEIGDFGLLIYAGFSRSRALFWNFVSALAAFIGVIIALVIGSASGGFVYSILPVTAGGLLYIAAADLVPELHKTSDSLKSVIQLVGVIAGFVFMVLLLFWE